MVLEGNLDLDKLENIIRTNLKSQDVGNTVVKSGLTKTQAINLSGRFGENYLVKYCLIKQGSDIYEEHITRVGGN